MAAYTYDNRTKYMFHYSGDLVLDRDYFHNILLPRKKRLYGLEGIVVKDKKREIMLRFYSVELYKCFERLGVQGGNKRDIWVPEFIMKGNKKLQASFIRGLFDSDGSLAFKKRHKQFKYYPVITITMKSKQLCEDVKILLEENGVEFTASDADGYDARVGKKYERHQIDINGVKRLNHWMDRIGFRNKRHLQKYEFWKLNKYYK
jgi:intein/homing endonuclease